MTNRGPNSSASGSTNASTGVLMVGPNFKVSIYGKFIYKNRDIF